MTMKHTQGPWCLIDLGSGMKPIVQRGNEGGFTVRGTSPDQEMADACLIAAAPDLLESAKLLIDSYDICRKDRTPDVIFERLRAAIAKATGEQI